MTQLLGRWRVRATTPPARCTTIRSGTTGYRDLFTDRWADKSEDRVMQVGNARLDARTG